MYTWLHHIFANGGDCAERVVMEDHAPTTFTSESIFIEKQYGIQGNIDWLPF